MDITTKDDLKQISLPFPSFKPNTVILSEQINDNNDEIQYRTNLLLKSFLNHVDQNIELEGLHKALREEYDNYINNNNQRVLELEQEVDKDREDINKRVDNEVDVLNVKIDNHKSEINKRVDNEVKALNEKIINKADSLELKNTLLYLKSGDRSISVADLSSLGGNIGKRSTYLASGHQVIKEDWTLGEDGLYSIVLNHNLSTSVPQVVFYDDATNQNVFNVTELIDANNVRVYTDNPVDTYIVAMDATGNVNIVQAILDDEQITNLRTWSSEKIKEEIDNKAVDLTPITNDLGKTENTKYSTENGIKEFECKDGYVDNIVIEGKTLVNLANYDMGIRALTESSGNIWTTNGSSKYGSFTESNGIITYNTGSERWSDFGCIIPVTEGQSIRFIVDVVENAEKINRMAMFYNDIPTTDLGDANIDKIISLNKTATSTELGLHDDQFKIPQGAKYGLFVISCSAENSVYKFKNLMLLENNTNDIRYFEGLKSVGQGDKIEVLTRCDKNNLFDGFTREGWYDKGIFKYTPGDFANVNPIEIKPNTQYTSSTNRDLDGEYIRMTWYDKDMNYISFGAKQTNTSPSNAKYMNIHLAGAKDAIINEGDTIISNRKNYDKKQISTTLRSLPNGVKDTIEKKGNKYVKVQRCREIVLDGNSTIFSISEGGSSSKVYRILCASPYKDNKAGSVVFCDKFKSYANYELDEEECYISINNTNGHAVCLKILKSKLENNMSKEKALEWLKSNPITVVYELATPIITELPNFNPQTYEGDTTFLINSGVIQANAEFEVTNSKGSEIEIVKDKLSDIYNYVDRELVSETNKLKSILESKNIEVSEGENKLPILIDKVNLFDDYIPSPLYLYKEGDECTDITGGWESITLRNDGTGSITNTKEQTYLYTKVTCNQPYPKFSGFSSKNTINLSDYSKIVFEYDYNCNTSELSNRLGIISDKTTSSTISINSRFIASASTISTGNKIISYVDISNINSLYYISYVCGFNNSVQTIKMYKIWLEK